MEKGIEDKLKALTAGKHKEAADVSLPTDVVLSKAAIYAPLGILAITFLYSPELTTEGGVEWPRIQPPPETSGNLRKYLEIDNHGSTRV